MVKTNVKIGGLELKNPVLTASGTFGYGLEFADFVDLNKLGGFIVKGTTLNHREGNAYPRSAETPMGMLNAVGLQNKGVDYFAANIYPQLKDLDTNVLVNVSGACIEDYVACAEKVAALDKIPGIELNISCHPVQPGQGFTREAEPPSPTQNWLPPDSTLPEFLEGVVKESPSSETRALASESHHTSLRGGPCPQEGGQLEGEVTALRPQTQKPRPT